MISQLRGTVLEKDSNKIILDVSGVGYDVELTTNGIAKQPEVGQQTTVYTYLHVRDDSWQLFGFSMIEEKALFKKLIGINGIGPKLAISILSSHSIEGFKQAVSSEDAEFLASVPRLGSKNAKRIILELKGKLQLDEDSSAPHIIEAKQALKNLGYSQVEINAAISSLNGENNAEEVVKKALRKIADG